MLGSIGVPELLIILVIVVLIFGVGKLPQLGRGIGESIRNFKAAMRDGSEADKNPKNNGNSPK
jgi:sec-independent protein translocase protein TatA